MGVLWRMEQIKFVILQNLFGPIIFIDYAPFTNLK